MGEIQDSRGFCLRLAREAAVGRGSELTARGQQVLSNREITITSTAEGGGPALAAPCAHGGDAGAEGCGLGAWL